MKKLYLLTLVALGITADLVAAHGGGHGGGGHGGGGHWGGGHGGWGRGGGWNRGGWGRGGWYGGYGLGWGWPYYGGGYYPYYGDDYYDDVVYVNSAPSMSNVVLMECDSDADCGSNRGLGAGKWYCDTSVNYCKRMPQTQALQRQAQAPAMAAQADDVDASDVDMN